MVGAEGSICLSKDYCHTRSDLGISALLEILQTGKLDHNVAIKCMWDQPPTASIISLTSMKARKLKFIGCLVGV